MKNLIVALIVSAVFAVNAAETDYTGYSRIMSDSGIGQNHSFESLNNPGQKQEKKLDLELDPALIKKAALEFECSANGYDRKLKTYIKNPNHNWHNMIFKVNGQVIFSGNPGKMMQQGVHRLDFDAKLLKKGENIISLGWAKRAKGDNGVLGYFYLAVDNNDAEKARRAIPKNKRPAPANESIRVRILVKL